MVSGSGGRHSRYGEADASADHVVEGVGIAVVDGLVVEAVYGHFGGNGQLGDVGDEEAREGDLPWHGDVGVNRDSGGRPDRISAGKKRASVERGRGEGLKVAGAGGGRRLT